MITEHFNLVTASRLLRKILKPSPNMSAAGFNRPFNCPLKRRLTVAPQPHEKSVLHSLPVAKGTFSIVLLLVASWKLPIR